MIQLLGLSKRTVLLRYPVRSWDDWLRPNNANNALIQLRFSLPPIVSGVNWIKSAIYHELNTSRWLRSGNTLTRSKVVASKRKLWRQKGTGRARAGSKSSPLWKSGGIVFGPHHSHSTKPKLLNQKSWKQALELLLYNKRGNTLVVKGPWNDSSGDLAYTCRGLKKFLMATKSYRSSFLILLPPRVSSDPLKQQIMQEGCESKNASCASIKVMSFSTVKCLNLISADFIIILV